MLCAKLTRVEGVVAAVLDTGLLSVELPSGESLRARISRRLGILQARFAVGDRVLLGLQPRPGHDALILTGSRARLHA